MGESETLVPLPIGPLGPERIRALPLAPIDGFILSRVDGAANVGDLAQVTGVPVDGVLASLKKLETLGVVTLGPRKRATARPGKGKSLAPPAAKRPPLLSRDEPSPTTKPEVRRASPLPRDEPQSMRPRALSEHREEPVVKRDSERRRAAPPVRRDEPVSMRPRAPDPRDEAPLAHARESEHRRAAPVRRSDPAPLSPKRPPVRRDSPHPDPPTKTSLQTKPPPTLTSAARPPPRVTVEPTPPPAPPPKAPISTPAAHVAPASAPAPAAAATPVAPGDIELDEAHQREITHLYDRLAQTDHYTLLGVPRTAEKKAIKNAYFGRTARFHPDRFFRKRLGPFKQKMEGVFGRMTEAHDVLTSAERRAEYDKYLASLDRTRGGDALLAEAAADLKRAEEAARSARISSVPPSPPSSTAQLAQPASSSQPSSSTLGTASPNRALSPAPPPAPPSAPGSSAARPPSVRDLAPAPSPSVRDLVPAPPDSKQRISYTNPGSAPATQDRRDLLARRLMGSGSGRLSPTPKGQTTATSTGTGFSSTEDAVGALKRRYEEKVDAARSGQVKKYLDLGHEALAKKEFVAAASAFRVALSFEPENAELKATHEKTQIEADRLLVDQYLAQASYEERSEKWAEAARSWQRVVRVRDADARAHERAAHCLVKSNGDLHDASALAQKAAKLQPKDPKMRVTLANVYLAAGLTLNAKRELEAAAQLDPNDDNVAGLLKRIAKSP